VVLIEEAGRVPVERDTLYNPVGPQPDRAAPERPAQSTRPIPGASGPEAGMGISP